MIPLSSYAGFFGILEAGGRSPGGTLTSCNSELGAGLSTLGIDGGGGGGGGHLDELGSGGGLGCGLIVIRHGWPDVAWPVVAGLVVPGLDGSLLCTLNGDSRGCV